MNITLSVDEKTVAKARKVAAAMGKSLNELIREDLQRLTRQHEAEVSFSEFARLSGKGNSNGQRFSRDELYERT